MRKRPAVPEPDEGRKKGFAGRAPLADLDIHKDPECTGRFSLAAIKDAVLESALEGGLTKEKAADVLSALPKKS